MSRTGVGEGQKRNGFRGRGGILEKGRKKPIQRVLHLKERFDLQDLSKGDYHLQYQGRLSMYTYGGEATALKAVGGKEEFKKKRGWRIPEKAGLAVL